MTLSIVFFIGTADESYAHTTKIIGDYKMDVGWAKEPAILGKPNAVEITIKLASDYDKQKYDPVTSKIKFETNGEAKKSDYSGIENFDATIELRGKKKTLQLSERPELPGVYYDYFTPQETGTPTVHIYGIIKNLEFESKFSFEKVKSAKGLENEEFTMSGSLIPNWVKTRAGWWSQEQIPDSDFIGGLEFLIKEGILKVPETQISEKSNQEIPDWVRNVAKWWSKGSISDGEFISACHFLIENGIIRI